MNRAMTEITNGNCYLGVPLPLKQRICLELDKEQEIASSTIATDGCSFYPNGLMFPSPLLLSKRWTKGRFGGTKHIPRNLPAGIFHVLPLSIDVSPFFVIC